MTYTKISVIIEILTYGAVLQMKKVFKFSLFVFILLFFGFTTFGCTSTVQEEQSEPELTKISVAGHFVLASSVNYPQYPYMKVTSWEYDFFNDGTVAQNMTVINTITNNISRSSTEGNYACYEEIDGLFVLWNGDKYPDDVKAYKYDGPTIYNGVATFELFSYNSLGEFAGKALSVEYSAETGGKVEGKRSQYLKKGESCSAVTAVPDYGYEFSHWSDGLTTATRQDTEIKKNLSVNAVFTALPSTHGVFSNFIYYYANKDLDTCKELYGEYYNCSFEVFDIEKMKLFFEQDTENNWQIYYENIESALFFKLESISSTPSDTKETHYIFYALKLKYASSDYKISYNDSTGSLYEIELTPYKHEHTIFYL